MAYLEDAGAGRALEAGRDSTALITRRQKYSLSLRLGAALFWLLVLAGWELAARAGLISALFFPPPTVIIVTLAQMLISGALLLDLGYTLFRLSVGLLLGGSLGLALGLLMGWSRTIRTLAEPAVAAAHPLPKVALLPLALIIFGIGEQSKIALIALAAFFPLLINSMAGVQQIDSLTWDVAHHYGARGGVLFRRVIWPASLPLVLVGLQLALNAALLVTVAVELVTAQQGLGATIWLAWQTLRIEELYATLVVIGLLGLGSNVALDMLARRLIPWQATR
jgi:NitT/TauT family transport system permease protein